jgi:hypothetical protein
MPCSFPNGQPHPSPDDPRERATVPPPASAVPATNAAGLTPLTCRHCGTVAPPILSPGTGPHYQKVTCASCGRFATWKSRYTRAERARRRAESTQAAMAKLAPTAPQLAYLHALGDTQPQPATRAEASQRIDHLLHQKGVAS